MEPAVAASAAVAPGKLSREFYLRDDVVRISRELLGKVVATCIDGVLTRAIITETEAYAGVDDRASHAFGGELIWIEDHGIDPATTEAGPRIGVAYAGEDAQRPYRFVAGSLASRCGGRA